MKKWILIGISAVCLLLAATFCATRGSFNDETSETSDSGSKTQSETEGTAGEGSGESTGAEPETEAPTLHISPVETVSAECATQQKISKTILRDNGSNTLKLPLADFIEEGDRIISFTFIIYSGDGYNIGEYKGWTSPR